MSSFLDLVRGLVRSGRYDITEHAFVELEKDDLIAEQIIEGVGEAVVVEEYPDYHKGPSVLVLQRNADGNAVHALWGIPKDKSEPAYLITAYRPDPQRWLPDMKTRRAK